MRVGHASETSCNTSVLAETYRRHDQVICGHIWGHGSNGVILDADELAHQASLDTEGHWTMRKKSLNCQTSTFMLILCLRNINVCNMLCVF